PALSHVCRRSCSSVFLCQDPATTDIYTLSLHDALPISPEWAPRAARMPPQIRKSPPRLHQHSRPQSRLRPESRLRPLPPSAALRDRKSTRLNSSHSQISYAVFCLKKKKKKQKKNY